MTEAQPDLFSHAAARFRAAVARLLINRLEEVGRPSAGELLRAVEQRICLDARWTFKDAVDDCSRLAALRGADRAYFAAMIEDGSVDGALRGEGAAEEETVSTIDALLQQRLFGT